MKGACTLEADVGLVLWPSSGGFRKAASWMVSSEEAWRLGGKERGRVFPASEDWAKLSSAAIPAWGSSCLSPELLAAPADTPPQQADRPLLLPFPRGLRRTATRGRGASWAEAAQRPPDGPGFQGTQARSANFPCGGGHRPPHLARARPLSTGPAKSRVCRRGEGAAPWRWEAPEGTST